MKDMAWRTRLKETLKEKGRSMRSVSLAVNKGPGYLHSIIEDAKDPTVSNLMDVCQELGVSLSFVLYGFDVTGETEEILSLLEGHPESRKGILNILREKRSA